MTANLESPIAVPRAHLVGIAGSGMRALATVLAQRGWMLSGSDLQTDAEIDLAVYGVRIFAGHAARHVPAGADRLIYSDAIPAGNPERQRALELGIPSFSYAAMLAEVSAGASTVAVAGTHGKSTVTAMVAEILHRAGLDPTVVCGARPVHGGTGGRLGAGKFNVVEACEYRENFLHLAPQLAALLNVELDHVDCFATKADVANAFSRFAARINDDGLLIASHDCPTAKGIADHAHCRAVTFGMSRGADWRAAHLEQTRGRYRFDLLRHGRRLARLTLSVPGRHNVSNALAAAVVARHCGVSIAHVVQGLAAFRGLKRRLEPRRTIGGVTWIDDYAHHPTEIAASLAALRQMFPRRRICCVFQPHQACRLTVLLDEIAGSLHNADRIAVADVFRAREAAPRAGEATAADLAMRLRHLGAAVIDEHDLDDIAAQLLHDLQPGDVLVTMGAGDLGKAFDDFHERLGRVCAAA